MAQLYARNTSVDPGGSLQLAVSSRTSRFRVDFYRQGATLEKVGAQTWSGGAAVGLGAHDGDWGWPTFTFAVPADWRTGVYLALCVEDGAPASAADITQPANDAAQALFVVRRSAVAGHDHRILYKVPLFTYAAYNESASPPGSLYTGGGRAVTLRRPGNGAGAVPWDAVYPDVYDPSSPRQTFRHWDQKFIQWLESNGYRVDYCTDLDLHRDGAALLSRYRLVLSVGHDEYWSREERDHLEAFIGGGGNVAFFSGNVCWWRVHLTDGDTALACDKDGESASYDLWHTGQSQRPENALTGVSYRGAGGHWSGPRIEAGYAIQHADHWVFDGVVGAGGGPLVEGEVIGAAERLVGYECDGAALAPAVAGQPRVATYTDGTPPSFLVLGTCDVSSFGDPVAGAASTATLGLYTRSGTVFTAATTDWARVLVGGHPQVDRITRNVLDKLSLRAVRIHGLGSACSANPVVEGATLSLWADTGGLTGPLTHRWTASVGAPAATDQPTLALALPTPCGTVTVSVTITDAHGERAFGTVTFTPMTAAQARRAALICRLRQLVVTLAAPRRPLEGVRDRHRWFVDPLWDPIRGYVGPPLDERDTRAIAAELRALADLAEPASERGA